MKQRRYGHVFFMDEIRNPTFVYPRRTELFNKAYNHISERIDQVYKDLTKGKAAPMGGVAYLSLEDNEVWMGWHIDACLVFVSLISFLRSRMPAVSSTMLCPL